MMPAEQSERERMAYMLDALLAITAVALNAEQIAQAGKVQVERRQHQTHSERDERGRWATVRKATAAVRRAA